MLHGNRKEVGRAMKLRISRKAVKRAALCVVIALLAWGAAAIAIHVASKGRVFNSATIDDLPRMRAGIVLGCVKTVRGGLPNKFFVHRIAAAAELYKAGKVDCLIVSGDNHVKGYDEASDMKASLVEAGIPAQCVVCDYAGFRTLDTVVRAKKVFGLDSFTLISQPDHVRRAVFLARSFGCDAYGYEAKGLRLGYSVKTKAREQLAKIGALFDAAIRRNPKFLGPREPLPGDDTLRLPATLHGEALPEGFTDKDDFLLEMFAADPTGAMRTNPVVLFRGRVSLLRGHTHRTDEFSHVRSAMRRRFMQHGANWKFPRLFIKADERCLFGDVSALLNLGTESGFNKMTFVTRHGDAAHSDGLAQCQALEFMRPCPCAEIDEWGGYKDIPEMRIDIGPSQGGSDDGGIIHNGKVVRLEQLDSGFGELARNPDFANESVNLSATMDAPYGTVVKVMDVLRKHGFWRIYLFTM